MSQSIAGPGSDAQGVGADARPVLQLPADRPRPSRLGREVGGVELALDATLARRLREAAGEAGTDVDAVLLAALVLLLARVTDEEQVVVGASGGAGRQGPDDGVLVVHATVPPEAGFGEVVERTRDAVAAAAALGEESLPSLFEDLGGDVGLGRHPVFQIGFAGLSGPGRTVWQVTPGVSVPPDLVLAWWPDGEAIRGRLDYTPDLFDAWRVERMAGHLESLLRSGLADPHAAVGTLPLLTDVEVAELQRWNATGQAHDPEQGVADLVEEQVRRTPDACAVELGRESLTYAELSRRADSVARRLVARGVGPDVPVAVCMDRSLEMVVGVLAVLKAGGAYVPVDPAYPAARQYYMIEDSRAPVVLTHRALRAGLPADLPADVLVLDDQEAEQTADPLPRRSGGRHLGYVVYTSGSTGKPKGVALPQSALTNLVRWQLRRPQGRPAARTLQFSSLSFDVSFQEIFSTWCSGGTLVLVADAARRDPLSLLDVLVEQRIERLFLPYVALRGLAAASAATGRLPHDLREVYTAGEQLQVDPLLRRLFAALPEAVLENQYGPSESHVVTALTLSGHPDTWPLLPPIGGPIANSEVHVLDSRRQLRPVGVPGELHIGGACLARGYLGKPEMTAERFVTDRVPSATSTRLYRTGDLVRWLPDGTLEFLGRLDHQVKFRGYRIEPGEVGAVLSGCPGVSQCVAAVREHEGTGSRLTAYLVPERGTVLDLAEVHAFARANLPAYMVPSHYLTVDDFPLTPSGKVDTNALPDAAFDRGILSSPYQAPRGPDELALAEIWRALLGVPDVGVSDDFFELGGDSLMAAEMLELIHARLGRELPLGALAQSPTIAQLAVVLGGEEATAVWRSLVPLRSGGSRTPLFVVHGGTGNVATFPRLARALPDDQPVYALQWDGLDGSWGHRRIEAMAEHYLSEIRTVQPHGPYLLAGQCVGGLVAREMSRRLLGQGERVDLLVMYDSPHLTSPDYVPGRRPSVLDYLLVANGRKANVRVLGNRLLRRPVPPRDRLHHGAMAMRQATWAHRPGDHPTEVPTHYFSSGEGDATKIALTGRWTDGAMGWAHCQSPTFTVHRIDGHHNEILYHPDALAAVADLLEVCHRASAGAGEAVPAGASSG